MAHLPVVVVPPAGLVPARVEVRDVQEPGDAWCVGRGLDEVDGGVAVDGERLCGCEVQSALFLLLYISGWPVTMGFRTRSAPPLPPAPALQKT